MKLKVPQLSGQLKQGLAALYVLMGDEPLQMMECADAIRAAAQQQGFNERTPLYVEAGFDWQTLHHQADSLSLFATKRLLELHLGNQSPGDAGGKALVNYTENLSTDTILLVTANRLDASKQKSKWFKALEAKGVVVPIWDIPAQNLPRWIQGRVQCLGLSVTPEAVTVLAERAEGHLLACAQELDKLHLLYAGQTVDIEQVLEAVADSARFEVFKWVDTVLNGNARPIVRQLNGLRAEGVEPTLILWALQREVRILYQLSRDMAGGQSLETVFKTHRIWQNRKSLVQKALHRHRGTTWQVFIRHSNRIDRMIKGIDKGNAWDELQQLSLAIAGIKLIHRINTRK